MQCPTDKTAYNDSCKTHYSLPYHNCTYMYNSVSEDEPSGLKHVEDIKKLKIQILI